MLRVHTVPRPYLATFHTTEQTYVLASDHAQELLDITTVTRATPYVVEVRTDEGHEITLRPATVGGGEAFTIEHVA